MEKFSDWRDKGTGIAPFLPPVIPKSNILGNGLVHLILLVKLAIATPLLLLNAILNLKSLEKLYLKIVYGLDISVTVQGVKRRDISAPKHYPQKNKLYLCNSSSPLDAKVLELIAQGSSVFLVAMNQVIYKMTSTNYMAYALSGSLDIKKFGKEVSNITQFKNKVCFLFPEGTCSNGKTILPFEINKDNLLEVLNIDPLTGSLPDIQTIHLKINSNLTTPMAVSSYEYRSRMASKSVIIKCAIGELEHNPTMDKLRVSLNDGNKFTLVSKSLDTTSKRKFVTQYKTNRK